MPTLDVTYEGNPLKLEYSERATDSIYFTDANKRAATNCRNLNIKFNEPISLVEHKAVRFPGFFVFTSKSSEGDYLQYIILDSAHKEDVNYTASLLPLDAAAIFYRAYHMPAGRLSDLMRPRNN